MAGHKARAPGDVYVAGISAEIGSVDHHPHGRWRCPALRANRNTEYVPGINHFQYPARLLSYSLLVLLSQPRRFSPANVDSSLSPEKTVFRTPRDCGGDVLYRVSQLNEARSTKCTNSRICHRIEQTFRRKLRCFSS